MRGGKWFVIAGGLVLTACATRTHDRSTAFSNSPPEPYVRVLQTESNTILLQIAARQFVPVRGKGARVWLTGVSHVGETNYFASLQKHLDEQSLVLFEGVSERDARAQDSAAGASQAEPDEGPAQSVTKQGLSSLQSSMADSLGLAFQLEAIDYTRPNFRNSDLSVRELQKVFEEMDASGGSGTAASFESLLRMMQGGSFLDTILRVAMQLLGSSPKLQGMTRLVLIETIGEMKGDPSQLKNLPPQLKQLLDVLIQRRNEKVISDLKPMLKQNDSISLFYGTGHMPDLEMRLRNELHYRPAGQVWLTAFSVDLGRTGISSAEVALVRGFVQMELEH